MISTNTWEWLAIDPFQVVYDFLWMFNGHLFSSRLFQNPTTTAVRLAREKSPHVPGGNNTKMEKKNVVGQKDTPTSRNRRGSCQRFSSGLGSSADFRVHISVRNLAGFGLFVWGGEPVLVDMNEKSQHVMYHNVLFFHLFNLYNSLFVSSVYGLYILYILECFHKGAWRKVSSCSKPMIVKFMVSEDVHSKVLGMITALIMTVVMMPLGYAMSLWLWRFWIVWSQLLLF